MTTPVFLDVDTGVDDAVAIALALADPEIDLVACSTLAGNIDVINATNNTLKVLDFLGAAHVPVFQGASRPLARPLFMADYFHGRDGLGDSSLPDSTCAIGPYRGPAAMIRYAGERLGELTLVCVGPLTNLAIALNVEPRLPEMVAGVVVMGGAFDVPGNVRPWAEFNIFCDPEAARQVFALAPQFKRFVAVGLDVSMRVSITRAGYDAAGAHPGRSAELIRQISRRFFEEQGHTQFHLHDPLAVAVAANPGIVQSERTAVVVDVAEDSRGRTWVTGTGAVEVARSVDQEAFLARFHQILDLPRG
jgi:purine nucleosidase